MSAIQTALTALLFAMFAATATSADALPSRPQIVLSAEDQAWIATHPTITIALDDANPPMNARLPDGSYAGISVDYLRLITAKAGLRLELAGWTWNESLGKAMRHEVDGIMSASYKEERRTALDFTQPYCETPLAILAGKDVPPLSKLSGLTGKRVAVVSGSVRIAILQLEVPGAVIVQVDNAGKGMRALAEGRCDAYFDDLPVIQDHMDRMMIAHLRVALLYVLPEAGAQRIGVRNDQPRLTAILDRAIAAITPAEHQAIRDRWLRLATGAAVQRNIGLTSEERAWLTAHPVIRIACDPDWAPVEWRDPQGTWRGVSIDYLKRMEEMLGVRFEIDNAGSWQEARQRADAGQVDMFACMSETSTRQQQWLFTAPYATFPITIFARADVGYLHGLDSLAGAKVAVVSGYVEEELVRTNFPAITVVTANSTSEALAMVRTGAVAAYVGGLLPTAYKLQQGGELGIHVVGETPFSYHQSLAVRRDWPVLHGILGKALASIPADERDSLWRRWITVNYQRAADLSLLWKLGLPLLGLLAFVWYWNRRLSAEVRNRTRVEGELIAYRDRLEELVRGRTADLENALARLRRLAASIDQTAEGVALASPDGRIDFVNPAFSSITGISSTTAIGKRLDLIGLPWDDEAVRLGRWRGRISGRRPDGTAYELEISVSAVHDGAGRIVDLLAALRDVTAERLIEERLARTQKLEAVGTLAGGIAHDFNNILAAILGSAELAGSVAVTDERRTAHLENIITACDRARDLVRQILTFARATGSERRPVDVTPIIAEALGLLRATLPATIVFRQQLAAGAVVMGDATRLHQVMMTLGTNAGLAMPQGGQLEVDLSIITVDAAFAAQHGGLRLGPAARWSVRDSGIGMTREVQARIFEPFFTTRPQGQGTGLGLSVVHGIVRDCDGSISVYSEPGQGTTFTIVLPIVMDAVATAPAANGPVPGGSGRILFVDDEPALRSIVAEMLGALGYTVIVAADGQEALDLVQREPLGFDVLITDSTMPRMTGSQLIARLATLAPHILPILCSGQGDVVQDGRQAHVPFLSKPVTMDEYARAIRMALGR